MKIPTPTPLRRTLVPISVGALLLGGLVTGSATAEPAYGLYEIDGVATAQERTEIADTGVAIDHVGDDSVLVTGSSSEIAELDALGYTAEPLSLPETYASPDPGYTTYPELLEIIDEVVENNPDIAAQEVYGSSYEGQDLVAIKISGDVSTDQDLPEVLFTHSQHAREHLTVEMAIYLMRLFTEGYGEDPRITELVDGREIWILPNVNPDGSEYDMAGDTWRDWRKNRQPNEGSSSVGTDLNRNWGYQWGCCGGSSGSPSSETYRGPSAFSAPETAAVKAFVDSRVVGGVQQIKAHLDFHSYSELVLWPYGYTYDDSNETMSPEEAERFREVGEALAASNGYTPQQSSDLYITDGSINDWMWAEHGILSLTFEMYPSGGGGLDGFYPPDERIEPETERNDEAVEILLTEAGNQG